MSSHQQGVFLDNVLVNNNQADDTILETHEFNYLQLYGHSSTNHSLVLIGANDNFGFSTNIETNKSGEE